jgi:hypothetical protein
MSIEEAARRLDEVLGEQNAIDRREKHRRAYLQGSRCDDPAAMELPFDDLESTVLAETRGG